MKRSVAITLILAALSLLSLASFASEGGRKIDVITINGIINPVAADYISKSIDKAISEKSEALIIELDTPGGLDTAMREIVKKMIASEVPVVVYVSPSGARAASAGAFITIAAHIAAMSKGTNIGAAHPVGLGGEKMDKTMMEKVENDAAAYIRSIAEKKGRNADWAEKAVRKSVSVTEKDALQLNVIDIVAEDLQSLLRLIDGRVVSTAVAQKTLKTVDAKINRKEMGLRLKILDLISNPNIAYILMILGFYGLFFELSNPGAIFPGVFGAICLILAFYSFQTLPINYAGLLLIVLAVILFIADIMATAHGILTIGGIVSMVLGSLMLIESPLPFLKISLWVILPAAILTALFFSVVVALAIKAHRGKLTTGAEGIIGMTGIAKTDIDSEGQVFVHGEFWSAFSDTKINKGEDIVVSGIKGLKLKVKRKEE